MVHKLLKVHKEARDAPKWTEGGTVKLRALMIGCFVGLWFIFFLFTASIGSASLIWNSSNDPNPNVYISNDSIQPDSNNWYQLSLPSWYNSNYVTAFTIDAYGYGDDSAYTIDIWRKLGGSSAPSAKIVGFNVNNGTSPFTLRLNLMNDVLYRNYGTGFVNTSISLANIALTDFDALAGQSFLIGYACHFYLDKTQLHIEQSAVPIPAAVWLLGSGLLGLAGLRRRFKK
jgi:hypothetical protein